MSGITSAWNSSTLVGISISNTCQLLAKFSLLHRLFLSSLPHSNDTFVPWNLLSNSLLNEDFFSFQSLEHVHFLWKDLCSLNSNYKLFHIVHLSRIWDWISQKLLEGEQIQKRLKTKKDFSESYKTIWMFWCRSIFNVFLPFSLLLILNSLTITNLNKLHINGFQSVLVEVSLSLSLYILSIYFVASVQASSQFSVCLMWLCYIQNRCQSDSTSSEPPLPDNISCRPLLGPSITSSTIDSFASSNDVSFAAIPVPTTSLGLTF